MIAALVGLYKEGVITRYQIMMDCLHMIDPQRPALVLKDLPGDVQDELLDYASRYDPRKHAPKERLLPTVEQVESAANWIKQARNGENGRKEMPDANSPMLRSK